MSCWCSSLWNIIEAAHRDEKAPPVAFVGPVHGWKHCALTATTPHNALCGESTAGTTSSQILKLRLESALFSRERENAPEKIAKIERVRPSSARILQTSLDNNRQRGRVLGDSYSWCPRVHCSNPKTTIICFCNHGKNFFASFLLISRLAKSLAQNRPCNGQVMYPGLVVLWRDMY